MSNELARLDEKGLVLDTQDKLNAACMMITQSGMCPKQFVGKPKDAMIAILAGRQIGWGPMQSLQFIAVVNGRPSLYGDGPTGLAYASNKVGWIKEWFELDGKTIVPAYTKLSDFPAGLTACWQTQRKDCLEPSPVARFSVGDAKTAGLWGKTGPWSSYPLRMLVMRARSWGLRDNYSDALQGITQAEEWADLPAPHVKGRLEAAIEPTPPGVDAVQGEVVDVANDAHATRQDKQQAIADVTAYIGDRPSLPAKELIVAVAKTEIGSATIETVAQLVDVVAAIKSGKYDLETGDRIPDGE
jgi:hypothetical protein